MGVVTIPPRARPLTRPPPAGENARRGPPSPLGEGKHRAGAHADCELGSEATELLVELAGERGVATGLQGDEVTAG